MNGVALYVAFPGFCMDNMDGDGTRPILFQPGKFSPVLPIALLSASASTPATVAPFWTAGH
jgi:hypothetical protein